jgi:hypothetical protein
MGAFDDAIREHLELKRRLGAPEEELERKENEAFGRTPLGSPASAQAATPESPLEEEAPVPEPVAEVAPSTEPPLAAPEDVELVEERSLAETEIEPDEVLPEEALEPERENGALSDDALDETPDSLDETPGFFDQETPDQDRLWFERKPPKDFDFDS